MINAKAHRRRSRPVDCYFTELRMKLTVIIRNDAPVIFCGDSPSYRTVTFDLTEEQNKQIVLDHVGTNGGCEIKEEISRCILE